MRLRRFRHALPTRKSNRYHPRMNSFARQLAKNPMHRRWLAAALALSLTLSAPLIEAAPKKKAPPPTAAQDPAADQHDHLPDSVRHAFVAARLPNHSYAVSVVPADGGPPLLAINTQTPMNPASVMKLVTTFAALDLLGPTHQWSTQFLYNRPLVDGVLDAPLYLRGNGDPKLNLENFWLMLREMRLKGLREIRGDLVVDRRAFRLPPHDPAAFDGEPLRPYNAGADPLLINFVSVRFLLVPDAKSKRVLALQETPDGSVELVNRLILADGECGDLREKLSIKAEGTRIELAGRYPAKCGERPIALMPFNPNTHLDGLFRGLWTELGGQWSGKVVDGETPSDASPLAGRASLTLAEVVRDVNKFSNNVMARHVFLSLNERRPATYEGARERTREWLKNKGIATQGFSIDNGSGLSRGDRITAEQLTQMLASAWQSPVMPELMSSLPILGEDGTLRKRGNGHTRGRAHLKTGYIDGVRALAGYVLDHQGKRWIFVGLINHANAVKGKEGLDALVDWVIQRPTTPVPHHP